jgi:hypothetical protein
MPGPDQFPSGRAQGHPFRSVASTVPSFSARFPERLGGALGAPAGVRGVHPTNADRRVVLHERCAGRIECRSGAAGPQQHKKHMLVSFSRQLVR